MSNIIEFKDLKKIVKNKNVYMLFGFNNNNQYISSTEVNNTVKTLAKTIKKNAILLYFGELYDSEKMNLGFVYNELKRKREDIDIIMVENMSLNNELLQVPEFVNYQLWYTEKNKKTRGTNSNNSKPLGATKVWYNLNKIQQFEHIFILNGDKVTLEEFTLLKELNIPYTYFLLKRKFNDDGKTLLKKNASLSEKIGLSYVISTLNDETQTSETQSDEKQVTENNQDKTTNLLPEICDKVVEKKKK